MNDYNWNDIGWNFMVGGDGNAYEGCGWYALDATQGRKRFISISFIGNFSDHEAPHKQLYAAQRFIVDGIKMNKIHQRYILHAHKSLITGDNNSGNLLYNQIILWSWSNMSKIIYINKL